MWQTFKWREWFSPRREKIKITIETSRSLEVHRFTQSSTGFCPACRTETIFIPTKLSAQVIKSETNAIEKMLVDERIHRQTAENESNLICFASLKRELEKGL